MKSIVLSCQASRADAGPRDLHYNVYMETSTDHAAPTEQYGLFGWLLPVISRRYPRNATAEDIRYLEKGDAQGRAVISLR